MVTSTWRVEEADQRVLLIVGIYDVLRNIRDRLSRMCRLKKLNNFNYWTCDRWRGCFWATKRQLDDCCLLNASSHARL